MIGDQGLKGTGLMGWREETSMLFIEHKERENSCGKFNTKHANNVTTYKAMTCQDKEAQVLQEKKSPMQAGETTSSRHDLSYVSQKVGERAIPCHAVC